MQPGMMQQPPMQAAPMAMQQPGMMQPGMMQQPPMQMMPDAWTILSKMESAEVQEKVRWGEVLTAALGVEVDFANQYKVVDAANNDVFFFGEETDFCTRQMKRGACADCVGWHVEGVTILGGQRTPFLTMKRDSSFTCCCFNRPVTQILDKATGNQIGSIRDPFACCDLTFQLMGPDGQDALLAKGGCCQWGLCCPLPCGPCAEVAFSVVDAKTQNEVGKITKKVPSCCKFLIDSEVDNYQVDFKEVKNAQWKAMLIALSVFIDFRYFSESQDPNEIGETGLLGAAMGGGGGMFGGDGGDAGGYGGEGIEMADEGGGDDGGDFDFGGDE